MTLTPIEIQAIGLSLWVALIATGVSLPLAVAMAYLLARKRFWGHAIVNAVTYLPLVLPPIVTGFLLLILFGRSGVLGQFGADFAFTKWAAALAAGVMAFPLMVRPIRVAIEAVDPKLEEVAKTMGAGSWAVFQHVIWPSILPGVAAAFVLGFAKSMGEFGATITFAANIPGETQTIPSAIFAMLQVPGQELAVARMIIISCLLSFGALLAAEYFVNRARSK